MNEISLRNKVIIGLIVLGGIFVGIFFREALFSEQRVLIENERVETPQMAAEAPLKENPAPIEGDVEEVAPVAPKEPDATAPKGDGQSQDQLKIVNKLVSFGQEKRATRDIDTIIIHSSYDALGENPFSINGIIDIYGQYGVAAHYLIAREGVVYRLVEDKNIAYHAGVSRVPDGRTNVNDFSIGVELVNTKTDKYTKDQYNALNKLLSQLKSDYKIKYVLGHNQIAPDRKDDPWNFEWDKVK